MLDSRSNRIKKIDCMAPNLPISGVYSGKRPRAYSIQVKVFLSRKAISN
jgi:hypothetical protein